ncbi:hypothetical protein GUITHDRAFT_66247, partial [Guillardia theta CCMP2712]
VVYVGRIPYGFFEDEMRGYFSQFGEISRIRVSRNKKTGKSKHYAFIEFEHPEATNLLTPSCYRRDCNEVEMPSVVTSSSQLHPALWRGANKVFKPANFKVPPVDIL